MTDLAGSQRLAELEKYRGELTGYCYRMLGSSSEAEDAVQEALVRAWRALDRFEGRSALRSWLYRIATNVCFDMLNGRQRRARPVDFGPAAESPTHPGDTLPESTWLQPIHDSRVLPEGADPAELTESRESIRLAFVAALQHLPARQRAVLILREVLNWRAAEVAELLDTSVASVNSALQRARATLSTSDLTGDALEPSDEAQQELLSRYVEAFESYDMDKLVALLHEDAKMQMPPYPLWVQGHDDIAGWMLGPGSACRGSRLVPTVANGMPAFGQYKPRDDGEGHRPWAVLVLEVSEGRIAGLNYFLDTETLFPLFGLPADLDEG